MYVWEIAPVRIKTLKYFEYQNNYKVFRKVPLYMYGKIMGTGRCVPDKVVDNDYLSTIVDTSDEWISSRTGIRERRIATTESTVSMAAEAARNALLSAGIRVEEVDMILAATASPDNFIPGTACEVQAALGSEFCHAVCMDINAACSGFIYSLSVANAFIQSGQYRNILVIGVETLSKIVDWSDRSTCVLFGDGAGAVVIGASEHGLFRQLLHTNGSMGHVLSCHNRDNDNPVTRHENTNGYVQMDGQEVFKFAVKQVPECIRELLMQNNVEKDEIKYYLLHQANIKIIKSVARRLGQDMEKFPVNLEKYGNTSAASIPILLDECNRLGMLKKGDKLVLSGFGGGLTWGAVLLEW